MLWSTCRKHIKSITCDNHWEYLPNSNSLDRFVVVSISFFYGMANVMWWWKCVDSFKFMFIILHIYICILRMKKKKLSSQLNRAFNFKVLSPSPSLFRLPICSNLHSIYTKFYFMIRVWQIISLKLFIAYRIWKTSNVTERDNIVWKNEMKWNESKYDWFVEIVHCCLKIRSFRSTYVITNCLLIFFRQFYSFFLSSLINQSKILEFVSSILKTLHCFANAFGSFVCCTAKL